MRTRSMKKTLTPMMAKSNIYCLPPEILLEIIKYQPILAKTCKYLYKLGAGCSFTTMKAPHYTKLSDDSNSYKSLTLNEINEIKKWVYNLPSLGSICLSVE